MSLLSRLRSLWRREQLERDIDDELHSHLDMRTEDNLRAGLPPREARHDALRRFGNAMLVKEDTRHMDLIGWIESVAQDLRFAARMLRRSPGFTAVAVLSLALGIGTNTAIFSIMDALLLRPLPVPEASQLVELGYVEDGQYDDAFSYPMFERLRAGISADVFSHVSGVQEFWRSNVTASAQGVSTAGEDAFVELVSGEYFSTMGVHAALGRTLAPEDDRVPGGNPVAVISYAYWKRRFNLAPDVVGRTLTLNDVAYSILGVTPEGFGGDWVGRPTDFWIPVTMEAQVYPERPDVLTNPNMAGIRVIGRLRPGVKFPAAQSAAGVTWRAAIADMTPELNLSWREYYSHQQFRLAPFARGYSPERETFTQPLFILLSVAGVVLLIACANIANLLLARSETRQKEITVRVALGAGPGRIARQLFTESLLLAAAGAGVGALFAQWGSAAAIGFLNAYPQSANFGSLFRQLTVHPDLKILSFTAGACLLTAFLFGIAPALRARKLSLAPALAQRGAVGKLARSFALGKALLVSQVALSLLLLIGAGLFVRTLYNLRKQDLGIDRQHVLLIWTRPGQSRHTGPELAAFYQAAQERVESLPGVLSASPSMKGLLREQGYGVKVKVPGYTPKSDPDFSLFDLVAPRFFQTVGMRMLAGRDFTVHDTENAPHVAVLNEFTARWYFGNQIPVGRHIGIGKAGREAPYEDTEVVGVVSDAKGYNSLRETDHRMIFMPYRQDQSFQSHPRLANMCLTVRTQGEPSRMKSAIRAELLRLDPQLPVIAMDSVEEQLSDDVAQEKMTAAFSAFFGALAVVLACIGLYGLISYTVARRTHEIGIRMALGASPAQILLMVLKESLALVLLGIAVGVAVALAITRLISSILFGIHPGDPFTVVAAALVMLVVAALAGYLPARRASGVDPLVALRYE